MSRGLTSSAIHALEELESSRMINGLVRGSICDPDLAGRGHHINWEFFGEMEWYLTCRQISHAADILNAYCQSVLADVIEVDSEVWDATKPLFKKKGDRSAAVDLLRKQFARNMDDIRKFFRDELQVLWNPQIDVIVTLRNKIVHQNGFDYEGEVAKAIAYCAGLETFLAPTDFLDDEIPIGIGPSGRLIIDARTGLWAVSHTLNNIHLMDQNISARFGIQTRRSAPRRRTFSFGPRLPGQFLPGIPLPCTGPERPEPKIAPQLPSFYPYDPMANPREAECLRTWERVRGEIDQFVRDYCAERGVEIRALNAAPAGSVLNHTIRGHDQHLGYRLAARGQSHRLMDLGIRMRQKAFIPFLTVWSDKTQMIDIEECALSEVVKEELQNAIDQV